MRIEEAAAATGLSPSMVRKLVRQGELPAARVGAVPLVLVADLVAFLEARRVDPKRQADRLAAELEASLARDRG